MVSLTVIHAGLALGLIATAPTRIELGLTRFSPRAGPALVSNGVPLKAGMLFPVDSLKVRFIVGGVEQALYSTPLAGRFPDGSIRSLLIQFRYDIPRIGLVNGWLELGVSPSRVRLKPVLVTWGVPDAVALPVSPDYLVETGIVGPTITSAASRALGGVFAQYEANASKFGQQHWVSDGANWAGADYYDRALAFYALWVRTGRPQWWQRASAIADDYRRGYLEANNYGSSPHWSQLEGVAMHYWMTGNNASRQAVIRTAAVLSPQAFGKPQYFEGRIQARMLLANMLACQLADPLGHWCEISDGVALAQVTAQLPSGCFRYDINGVADPSVLLGQSNYMEGIRGDALVKYYLERKRDPHVRATVIKLADCLMGQWSDVTMTFRYWSAGPPADYDFSASTADLNGLFLVTYGFAYYVTGDVKYRNFGDKVFASAVSGAWLDGTKQYNQSYYDSYSYLWFRQQHSHERSGELQ